MTMTLKQMEELAHTISSDNDGLWLGDWSDDYLGHIAAYIGRLEAQNDELRGKAPVLGECEECGHTIVTPLRRLSSSSVSEREWIVADDGLPDEDRPVFFMTATAHWAGSRIGDEWRGTGDELICRTYGVVRWMYAPFSKAYPQEGVA